MLNILRKKGVAKKILWVVAIVIIISFGFFGRASIFQGTKRITYAGKIFNKKISFRDYEKIYKHNYIQAMIRHGENFNKVKNMLNLDSETWDRIILLHEAKKRRIKVKDEEIIKQIAETPFFQRDNQFDTLLYNDILRRIFRMTPTEYEESVKDSLKLLKLYDMETAQISLSDDEMFETYRKQNEKVQISYVLVTPGPFEDKAVSSEEEQLDYYSKNKLEFMRPPTINTQFVKLPFPEKPVTDEMRNDTENLDKDNVKSTEDELAEEEAKEETREKAIYIYNDLIANPDMKEVADQYEAEVNTSGPISSDNPNLSLGWTFEILNKVFEMNDGEISEPLETDNAIFIVKVTEKNSAYVPEYEETKEEVRKAVLKAKARKEARVSAEEILVKIKEGLGKTKTKDFPQVTKQLGLNIYQTPVFTRGQYLPIIGISKDFQEEAFNLNETNDLSGVVETEKGFAILHRDSYTPADKEAFEGEKNIIYQQLIVEKKMKAFTNFLNNLRIEAKLVDNISKLKKQQEQQ